MQAGGELGECGAFTTTDDDDPSRDPHTIKSKWLEIWPAAPDTAIWMVFFHVLVRLGSSCIIVCGYKVDDLIPRTKVIRGTTTYILDVVVELENAILFRLLHSSCF